MSEPDNYDHIVPANPGFELITIRCDLDEADEMIILVDIEPIIAWVLNGLEYTEPNVPITPGGNFDRDGGGDWQIFWRFNGGAINRFSDRSHKFATVDEAVDFFRSRCGDLSPTAKVIMR